MTAALKSLSTSSNNSVIGLPFLIQMEIAPVLGKRDLFLMQPGHLCISFQILLKPGLADFLCSREVGQVRTLPAAARWGESPGSQWPVLTWGEGVCLLTARKGGFRFLTGPLSYPPAGRVQGASLLPSCGGVASPPMSGVQVPVPHEASRTPPREEAGAPVTAWRGASPGHVWFSLRQGVGVPYHPAGMHVSPSH